MADDGGDERLSRARFIATAHHEMNTPLAIVRGWLDTLDDLWDELDAADRRRGISTARRSFLELAALLDAVFTDVRADALARDVPTGTSDVAATLAALEGRQGIGDLTIDVEEGLRAETERTVLETLALQATAAVATCDRSPRIEAFRRADDVVIEIRGAGSLPDDPFEPFPEGRSSLFGIRMRSARQLANAVGGEVAARQDGDDVVVTVRVR